MNRFWNKFSELIYNIRTYIKNIIKWSPILWKDQDWDHDYIFNTLSFKIENTSKYIAEHKRYVGYERDVEIMNTCVRLLKLVKEEGYMVEYHDYYITELSIKDHKLESKVLQNNLDLYFDKYRHEVRMFKKVEHREDESYIALMIGYRVHEKARRILFKLLERNIERWWD